MSCVKLNLTHLWIVLLLIGSTTVANGQTRCCGPKLFQADILQKVGQYDKNKDKAMVENNSIRYYYDYNNKMVASIVNVTTKTAGSVINEHLITDFNKGKTWTIKDNKCTVVNVEDPMSSPCIPDGAEFLGSHKYINMPVDFWAFTDNHGTSVRTSVTKDQCVMVSETLLTKGPVFNLVNNFFENVKLTIEDRKVFEVPASCPKTTKSMADSLHTINSTPVFIRH